MKKIILFLLLIVMLTKSQQTYAYDEKANYFDGEVWHVTQSSKSTCSIRLIAVVENDYPGVEEIFRFEALDADFGDERTGSMIYEFYTDKNEAIGSIGNKNIYVKSIPLEPGTYDFNSLYEYEFVHNLSIDFNSIKQADPENFEDNVVSLADGQSVTIYTMLGSEEWANKNMEEFENWARIQEGVETVSYKEIEDKEASKDQTISDNTTVINPISDPEVTLTETTKLPEDDKSEEKNISLFPYIKVGAIILIILGACVFIIKRRED